MAVTGLNVRVSAEIANFARDMNRAQAEVSKFAGHVNTMGSTLTKTGTAADRAGASFNTMAAALPKGTSALKDFLGTAGTAAFTFGSFSMAAGEITKWSGDLTKGWNLLRTGATQLAPAVTRVAGVLGPIGIAAAATGAGVALLANDFAKLGAAITAAKTAAANFKLPSGTGALPLIPGVKSAQIVDPHGDSRTIPREQLTGRKAHVLEAVSTSAAAINRQEMSILSSHVSTVAQEWSQMLAGLRPYTEQLTARWVTGLEAVNAELKRLGRTTGDDVNQLIAMRDTLDQIFRPRLDIGDVLGPPRDFAKGAIDRILNPAHLADDLLGATGRTGVPTPGLIPAELERQTTAFREGWMQVRSAIVDQLPLRLSMLISGRTAAGAFGGAVGGAFGSGVSSYLVRQLFHEQIKDKKGKVLSSKLGEGFGAQLGSAVLPIIGSVGGAWLGSKMGDLFGSQSKRMVEMWDTAQRRYVKVPADQATSSLTKFARELDRVTQTTISNIPTGFKIARFIDAAADPETSLPSGTNRRGMYVFQIGTLSIRADNPDDFAEQMSMAAEKAVRRGGVSGFQLAVAQTARGY